MPIKLAFSTAACPEWSLAEVARQAKAMGYAGVDLRTVTGAAGLRPASDPASFEPEEVGRILRGAGVEPACLSTGISLHDAGATRGAQGQVREALAAARRMGCGRVAVRAGDVPRGESHAAFILRVGLQLEALADDAEGAGVQLLIENGGTLTLAREWWTVLDLVDHPMVGLAWNLARAIDGGERPTTAMTVLNSRLRLVKAADATMPGGPAVMVGDGAAGAQDCVKRLLGIGFDGWISMEWDRLADPRLAPAETALPEAAKRLRGWLDEVAKAGEAAAPKAKAVAKARG
ncbi:MAG: sugar phosphate isomerase/epimerase [Planctomycetota bacterium]|nr:sugar phosphate isomerase/epimerase [Planctomycetota bacterium]